MPHLFPTSMHLPALFSRLKRCFVQLVLLVSVGLFAASAASAAGKVAPPGAADARAIEMVVRNQIYALSKDDAESAFSYASPHVRKQFDGAQDFLDTVHESFPVVGHATAVQFMKLQVLHGKIYQPVQMAGADGKIWLAVYAMQRQRNGKWKVNGCQLLPTGGFAT